MRRATLNSWGQLSAGGRGEPSGGRPVAIELRPRPPGRPAPPPPAPAVPSLRALASKTPEAPSQVWPYTGAASERAPSSESAGVRVRRADSARSVSSAPFRITCLTVPAPAPLLWPALSRGCFRVTLPYLCASLPAPLQPMLLAHVQGASATAAAPPPGADDSSPDDYRAIDEFRKEYGFIRNYAGTPLLKNRQVRCVRVCRSPRRAAGV